MKHLSHDEVEALVMGIDGVLDGARRRHLAACPECAQRLAREARLELALYAVAAETSPTLARAVRRGRPAPAWRIALSAAAMLALIAVGVRVLLFRRPPAPPPAAPVASLPAAPVASAAPVGSLPAAPVASLPADTPCLRDPVRLMAGCITPTPPALDRDATRPTRPGLTD